MGKAEDLKVLQSILDRMNSMTDEELFNYMMERSPTFRKDIEEFEKEHENETSNSTAIR